ncbi:hypothetical protein DERP_000446 [Dermatophagoides pteronyssinus]|uniref:Uncharacterized protein n=1 Tax=Dermatophagoides pteronyssinus TaxID=6956 RepID=A0ABQ8J0A0_DERPT|nr:hypothetical protein DERP_000446 [Dermatophagoides pteronyssinus]
MSNIPQHRIFAAIVDPYFAIELMGKYVWLFL